MALKVTELCLLCQAKGCLGCVHGNIQVPAQLLVVPLAGPGNESLTSRVMWGVHLW